MVPGGAAALAGLRRGDVLVSADGMPMKFGAAGMGAGFPGQRVNYLVLRDGKELQVAVTLATRRVLRLRSDSTTTADQLAVRKRWLARPAPGATPR
jgi:C-terminal processing protease CtpA/Prc